MTLLVKLGGHALDSLASDAPVLADLAHDVAALRAAGERVVIVHGGGPQIAALLATLGIESRFADGLRITDEQTMDAVVMALSDVNVRIVAALEHNGLRAVGLSGVDATTVSATALGEPWLRAGGLPVARVELLDALLDAGYTPVVSPLASDGVGGVLNCNADTVAGALAGALRASLYLLSDIDQLRRDADDPSSALDHVSADEVQELVASGAAKDGMRPKVIAALDALAGGATRITMGNGTRPHALREILAGNAPTTEITL